MHILTKFILDQPTSGPTLVWPGGLLDRVIWLLVAGFLLAAPIKETMLHAPIVLARDGVVAASVMALLMLGCLGFAVLSLGIAFEPNIRTTVQPRNVCFRVQRRLLGLRWTKSFAFDEIADFVVETVADDEDGPSDWLYLVPIHGKRPVLVHGKNNDDAELWRAAGLFKSELRRFKPLASERQFSRRRQSILKPGVTCGKKSTPQRGHCPNVDTVPTWTLSQRGHCPNVDTPQRGTPQRSTPQHSSGFSSADRCHAAKRVEP
jgi:hypothetical protein